MIWSVFWSVLCVFNGIVALAVAGPQRTANTGLAIACLAMSRICAMEADK